MNPQANQEIYRVAYESASAELVEISEAFDKLRARVDKVEKLIAALKPLAFDDEKEAAASTTDEKTPEPAEASAEAPSQKEAEPARVGADPFQHRINHVLGIGAGIRDVRSYTRQF